MMFRTIWTVFRKELIDSLRDRRTLFTILITAIAMGPVALLLLANFISGVEQKNAAKTIYVDGIEHAAPFANFLARNDISVLKPPEGYEQKIRTGSFQEAVIVIPADFTDKLKRAESIDVRLVFDDSRNEAQPSIRKADALLRAYSRETAIVRAIDRGVSPQILRTINVERVNTATPKQQGALLLFLIPMFALIGTVVGSMSAAIDITAGERERGSLEPLMMNPIDLRAMVIGKWLTVAAHSCGVVLLTLGGFAVATHLVTSERLNALIQFGIPEFLRFSAMAIPFAWMIAALQMLVATYGRTYKEAQTYASYIALVINFVPLVTVFASVRDALWQLAVPALAQQMVLSRMLRGDPVLARDYLIPLAVSVVLTVVFLGLLVRLLRQERIVFGR